MAEMACWRCSFTHGLEKYLSTMPMICMYKIVGACSGTCSHLFLDDHYPSNSTLPHISQNAATLNVRPEHQTQSTLCYKGNKTLYEHDWGDYFLELPAN